MSYRIVLACFVPLLCNIKVSNAIHPVNVVAKPEHSATGFLDLSTAEGSQTEEESFEGVAAILLKPKGGVLGGLVVGGLVYMICCGGALCCLFLAINAMSTKGKDDRHHREAIIIITHQVEKDLKDLPQNIQKHFDSPEFDEFCKKGFKEYYNKFVHLTVEKVFGKAVAEDQFLKESVTFAQHEAVHFETLQDVKTVYTYCEITLYKKEKRMVSLKID